MLVTSKWANHLIFFFLTVVGFMVATRGVGVSAEERLKPPLQTLDGSFIYSTYLGGELTDAVQAMAVDDLGRVYVVGTTQSTRFPDAGRVARPNHGVDAFVGRLSADGSALEYLFWFNAVNAADVDESPESG